MDIGVWMSKKVWERKRAATKKQTWNVGLLPDEFGKVRSQRMFVAIEKYWRGYFTLYPEVLCHLKNTQYPYSVVFDPQSWTPIEPVKAPARPKDTGFAVDMPELFHT